MREIKFRGMDLQGRWFYGLYANVTTNKASIKKGTYISNSVGMAYAYAVRPKTIEQYTGLKDKNGVEIYDGDYILYNKHKGVVFWKDDSAGFWVRFKNHSLEQLPFELFLSKEHIEVIGNIHEEENNETR